VSSTTIDGVGKAVTACYKPTVDSWKCRQKEVKIQPLVIGKLEPGASVHVFESQVDGFAFMGSSGEEEGILITRGTSDEAGFAELLPQDVTVYAWT
jgi:hypothetical protein